MQLDMILKIARFGNSEGTLRFSMEILDVVNSWILKFPICSSFFSRFWTTPISIVLYWNTTKPADWDIRFLRRSKDTQNPGINYILELLQVQHIQISISEITIFDIFANLHIKFHHIKLHWGPYCEEIDNKKTTDEAKSSKNGLWGGLEINRRVATIDFQPSQGPFLIDFPPVKGNGC